MPRDRKSETGWFARLRDRANKIGPLDDALQILVRGVSDQRRREWAADRGMTWAPEQEDAFLEEARSRATEICTRFAALSSGLSRADPLDPYPKDDIVVPSQTEMSKRMGDLEAAAQSLIEALRAMTADAMSVISQHSLDIVVPYALPFCRQRQAAPALDIVASLLDLAADLERKARAAVMARPTNKGGRGRKADKRLDVLEQAARSMRVALAVLDEASAEWFLAVPPPPLGPGLFRSPGAPGPTGGQREGYVVLRAFRERAIDTSCPWPRAPTDAVVEGIVNIVEIVHSLAVQAVIDLSHVFGENKGGYSSNIIHHLVGNPLEYLARECMELYVSWCICNADDAFWRPPRTEDDVPSPVQRIEGDAPLQLTRAVYRAAKRLRPGASVPEAVDLAFRVAGQKLEEDWAEMKALYEAALRGG